MFIIIWLGVLKKFCLTRALAAQTQGLVKTLAVLIILGLINFLAFYYCQPIDLTENKLFTLSPQSQEILKNLAQPLKVWLFEEQSLPAEQQLLEKYSSYSTNFSFEVVNPDVKLGIANKFGVNSQGEIYLEYGTKKKRLEKTNPQDALSEEKLTNGIIAIQRDRLLNIYLIQGHGEPPLDNTRGGLAEAIATLKDKGYQVKTLNLAQSRQPIPKDASVTILAGAVRPLLPPEIKAVKDYLDQGGRFGLMIDPRTNIGLEGILKDWGIQLDNRLVIDASGIGSEIGYGSATVIVTDYGNHPITANFRKGISLYPLARAISTNQTKDTEAIALLITNDRTWAESNLTSDQAEYNPKEDIKGPLDIGVALRRKYYKQGKTMESRLVILGNSTFATNGWFKQQLNGDVFINSIGWLGEEEPEILTIGPKEPKNRRLNLEPSQAELIFWLAVVIVPLLGFLCAFLVWLIRR